MDTQHLPFILELLDDETPVVRSAVVNELSRFGPNLPRDIQELDPPVSLKQKKSLDCVLQEVYRRRLKRTWSTWFDLKEDEAQLERALALLAEFQSGVEYLRPISYLLDELAQEFRQSCPIHSGLELAQFLFVQKEIKGEVKDYYNPQNSNLVYVIQNKKGIPISLTCLFILVAKRLGINVRGCNFPRHFMAIVHDVKGSVVLDCFHGGRIVTDSDLQRISQDNRVTVKEALALEANSDTIIKRALGNLIWAYQQKNDEDNSYLMVHLLKELRQELPDELSDDISYTEEGSKAKEPIFYPGQIITHKNYAYKGIIVDCDMYCMASEEWYQNNQTQPSRNQPWYHVLVHDSDQITYVAQSNLEEDDSVEEIHHPLITHFFERDDQGYYYRNDQPWPE